MQVFLGMVVYLPAFLNSMLSLIHFIMKLYSWCFISENTKGYKEWEE